jgi:dTDP-glucose 4,6-dehydratase
MKKTALVTGGAGFIGSHICDYLMEKNLRVICMDNLITGSLKNIEHIKSGDFIFLNHDITQYIDIKDSIDYIYHLASPASPIDYLQLPIQTLKVGSMGTHNILGLAKVKRAKMLLASTSEVYGDPKIHPQAEEYWGNVNPVGPRGVYDEAKRFAEALTMAYHRQQGLDTCIARIFNTYGPRMRKNDGRAVPTFLNQCLEGKDITVFGDGSQTRSFCYISDTVEGIYKLINSNYNLPLNIGNPEEMTILELAKNIKSIIKSKNNIIFQELPCDDPMVRKPDITKAKNVIDWEPRVSFRDGIERTIKYYKNINK